MVHPDMVARSRCPEADSNRLQQFSESRPQGLDPARRQEEAVLAQLDLLRVDDHETTVQNQENERGRVNNDAGNSKQEEPNSKQEELKNNRYPQVGEQGCLLQSASLLHRRI